MVKIQQYHESVAAARKQIAAWRKDPFSSFGRDYDDQVVTKITLAKTNPYGTGANKRTPTGRRLYTIHMRKRKR